MTLPATVYELPNLQQALDAMGLKARKTRVCLTCPREVENAAIVDTTALDCDLPRFVCVTCASASFRLAQAAEPPPETTPWGPDCEQANHARAIRWQKLTACDWTQVPDAPLTPAKRDEWAAYRQALRDITETFADPAAVVWPEEPLP